MSRSELNFITYPVRHMFVGVLSTTCATQLVVETQLAAPANLFWILNSSVGTSAGIYVMPRVQVPYRHRFKYYTVQRSETTLVAIQLGLRLQGADCNPFSNFCHFLVFVFKDKYEQELNNMYDEN